MCEDLADAFNRMYYFECASETYIKALKTNQILRVLNDKIAEKTAKELNYYPEQTNDHFNNIKEILNQEGYNYKF